MGSPQDENGRRDHETPVHSVMISQGFWMGRYEVTQAQYQAVMDADPSTFTERGRPVEYVSWIEANEFCSAVSDLTGFDFALPSEAQWEYACRAGTSTRFYIGEAEDCAEDSCLPCTLAQYAWYCGNANDETHPVGEKLPNAFGLFDMSGNVWEWCADTYQPNYYDGSPGVDPVNTSEGSLRVFRGGSFLGAPKTLRSAERGGHQPTLRRNDIGFRVIVRQPVSVRGWHRY